ncbi:N-carbamoylsarcosine amidohydrolase [Aggregatilineales bacterium SYSU G02658]
MDENLRYNYMGVFDGRLGFGRKAALLVIDFICAYTTPGAPFYAPAVVEAVQKTVPLLERARQKGVPVIYTKVVYHPTGADGGLFVQKIPSLRALVDGEPLAEIVPELTPAPNDVVVVKQYASAFFGTSLAPMLASMGVDTVILTGCSTSGCIRASAVDGMQHGFRVIVPRECVADRHPQPHEANLFDIDSKYGDVVDVDAVYAYLDTL